MGELPLNQVIHGNCVEVMQEFPDDCIDLVVTDPPYGLGFMGKEWDKALPPREAFKEAIRVLKPGALAFVMSSPRQDLMWRMMRLMEEAGFELRQSFISWVYKTGFPKAYDVSKGIDQKLGLEPKIIGVKKYAGPAGNDQNFDSSINIHKRDLTEPSSDEAKRWDGWKSITGLKPALEPILMVNKPMSEKTIVDNVLRWGTGAINVDSCRITIKNGDEWSRSTPYIDDIRGNRYNAGDRKKLTYEPQYANSKGRFPANLLVSDDALNDGEASKSGRFEPQHKIAEDENGHSVKNVYGKYNYLPASEQIYYGDEGSKSRYFDLDAWAEHHGIFDVPKPDTSERDYGLRGPKREPKSKFNKSDGKNERFDGAVSTPRRNTHPTVKPIRLMAYLIELGCPRNGVVLDPFVGSGTTCIAAKQLGRRYIGIEIDRKYHALAEARVAAYPQPLEWFTEEAPTNLKQTKRARR